MFCFSSLIILWFSIVVLISQDGFIARFVGNSFWLIALGYYIYITFLGYSGKFMILYLFNNSAYYLFFVRLIHLKSDVHILI